MGLDIMVIRPITGATKTIWADVCGATVMLTLSALHVIINGTFL